MIDLYNWHTSNGRKLFIMLEELGADYNTHAINIMKDDQFTPEFLAINPNGKIPGMIDQDGPGGEPFSLFESGAMLMYLADKYGRFLPPVDDIRNRYITLQWLMSHVKRLIVSMVYRDGGVTLYRKASHPVSHYRWQEP